MLPQNSLFYPVVEVVQVAALVVLVLSVSSCGPLQALVRGDQTKGEPYEAVSSTSASKERAEIGFPVEVDTNPFLAYKTLYGADCVEDKVTDNWGKGFDALYGTRNFRPVLHGVAYRGGANNYYHKTAKRSNKNPLPNDGLQRLLEGGFSSAVYLYKANFETAPAFLVDNTQSDTLHYYQIGGNTPEELDTLLQLTYASIVNEERGPVYLHCWNGWHQSGFVSAILLKQFCGYDDQKSVHYWEDCADTWTLGYERIRTAIRDFEPVERYAISPEVRSVICPCYADTRSAEALGLDSIAWAFETPATSLLFPASEELLPPSISTYLDEYAAMLKDSVQVAVECGFASGDLQAAERAEAVRLYLMAAGADSALITCVERDPDKPRRLNLNIVGLGFSVSFERGGVQILSGDKLVLNRLGAIIPAIQNSTVEISGHSDAGTGDDFVNNHIAKLRALRVYEYLQVIGVDMTQVVHKSCGSNEPRYGDERDRRVEFEIVPNK
jgi:hypothetical protein